MLFNRRPRVFFNTDDPAAVTPVAEPVAPVVPAVPASPWAADASAYFGDNAEAIAGFDRYMREKQQPYITSLEEGSKEARELWTDLNADPATTMRDLFTSVYSDDPDAAARYDALFAEPTPAEPVVATPEVEIPEWAKPLVESHQQKVDRELRESNAADYTAAKLELQVAHPDLTDEDLGLIDPFVVADGNLEAAYGRYQAYNAAFLARHGITPAEASAAPTPPPVLGDGATTAATPPLATQYKTYDQMGDAIQNFVSRQAASATPPPVVG